MTASPEFGPRQRTREPLARGHVAYRRLCLGALALLGVLALGVFSHAAPADATYGHLPLAEPVTPFTVQRLASLPPQPWLAGHRGLDLEADIGQPVSAPASGVVIYVGFVVDRPVLSIRHDQGLVSSFEPLDSAVGVGDIVSKGDGIGTVADAGHHCAASPCVHWGLRLDGAYVDPLDYLEGFGPIRLLPSAYD